MKVSNGFCVGLCYILSTTNLRSETGGLEGGGSPPSLRRLRSGGVTGGAAAPREKFFLDPILGWANLPMVLCMIFAHGIGRDGFSVHGIGCFGMYKYVL